MTVHTNYAIEQTLSDGAKWFHSSPKAIWAYVWRIFVAERAMGITLLSSYICKNVYSKMLVTWIFMCTMPCVLLPLNLFDVLFLAFAFYRDRFQNGILTWIHSQLVIFFLILFVSQTLVQDEYFGSFLSLLFFAAILRGLVASEIRQ